MADVILTEDERKEAGSVFDFLKLIGPEGEKDFENFIAGAKFMHGLKSGSKDEKTA